MINGINIYQHINKLLKLKEMRMINTNKDISIFELQGKRVVHNEL
jgi:hypothetical protein